MKRTAIECFWGNRINKKHLSKRTGDVRDSDSDGEGDGSDGDNMPPLFPFPISLKSDNKIYLNENHLFFNEEVNEHTVDVVKKLMRNYVMKTRKASNNFLLESSKIKPLYLHLYTPGGLLHAGFSLYDFIISLNNTVPVYTIIEGMAASAGTIISMAGVKRYITPSSYMLIHELSAGTWGKYSIMKEELDNCQKLMDKIIDIYTRHATIPKKKLLDILKHDIIWDASECLKFGLVHEIKHIDVFTD
jgi:ATP-dependent Clp protease protease subunit